MNSFMQVRRATLDDLARLRAIWAKSKLDSATLEKRLTEFQVVEADGLVACIGIKVENQQGLIHSEAIANFTQRDQLAPVLWERIQTIARNHGLHRLWIEEPDPCWMQHGFVPAGKEQLRKLPVAFGRSEAWHTLQLKEENIATLSLEQELELFSQAQKQSTEETLRQARVFKKFAYGLLWLVVVGLIALLIMTVRHPVERKRLSKQPENFGTNVARTTKQP